MQVGKRGLTQEFTEEIKKNLKANYQVKIRLLPSFLSTTTRFDVKDTLKDMFPRKKVKLVGKTITITK